MKFKPLIIRPIKGDLFDIPIEDIIDIKINIDKEILIFIKELSGASCINYHFRQIVLKRDDFYYPRWMNLIDTLNKIFKIE